MRKLKKRITKKDRQMFVKACINILGMDISSSIRTFEYAMYMKYKYNKFVKDLVKNLKVK